MTTKFLAVALILFVAFVGKEAVQVPRDWRTELLHELGNDNPTLETLNFIEAWHRAEGAAEECHNPFNTTLDRFNAPSINSVGVKCYATYEQGVQATIETLNGSYRGYYEIREGIRTNDPALALNGLESSPWGTSTVVVKEVYDNLSVSGSVHVDSVSSPSRVSNVLNTSGCMGVNINAALQRGNLTRAAIAPGYRWSFNEAWGNVNEADYVTCGGVSGGGLCNLAALFAQVARQEGLEVNFQDHGLGDIGGGSENSVMIWNTSGQGGDADLTITNPTSRTVTLQVVINGDTAQVIGD